MNVPLVVKTAIRMNANMATDGPANHSHHEMPRNLVWTIHAGPSSGPSPSARWTRPRGSWNQFGPLMPTHDRISLTTPVALKRNSQRIVIATELVIDGK